MNTDVYATESIAFNSNVSMLNPALQNLVGGGVECPYMLHLINI